MRTLSTIAVLMLVWLAPAAASPVLAAPADNAGTAAQYPVRARIWVDGERDFFRRGDRLRINFTTTADAFVAVVHIDPQGRLDFLFPASPFDEEYVAAGRVYSLPYRNTGLERGALIRSGPGIGYLYIVASPTPLDYGYFRGRGGYGWDWSYAGQSVHGDPFWAMEQLTRYLVPDWGYAPIAVDYYSYHVEGRHRYPAYACSSYQSRSGWGWGWGGGYTPAYYGSCDRLDYFLRTNPYYFDTFRYRTDRRSHFRDYGPRDPRHRYKEDPDRRGAGWDDADDRYGAPARGSYGPGTGSYGDDRAPRDAQPVDPARRPTLERRDPERQPPARGTARPAPGAPPAARPAPRGEGSGSGSGAAPARTGRRRPDGG